MKYRANCFIALCHCHRLRALFSDFMWGRLEQCRTVSYWRCAGVCAITTLLRAVGEVSEGSPRCGGGGLGWFDAGERGRGGEEMSRVHKNSKPTERYTYMSDKNIDKIKSPLV